jgi:hypothetical protein
MAVRVFFLSCLVILGGCATKPPAEAEFTPLKIQWVGYGHRQLSPEGWTFIQVRQTLTNTTGQTIWVPQSLWRKPAYEPARQPTLATEPKTTPMRPLKQGQHVTFHEWALVNRPHQTLLWYRPSPQGSLLSLRGPKLKP